MFCFEQPNLLHAIFLYYKTMSLEVVALWLVLNTGSEVGSGIASLRKQPSFFAPWPKWAFARSMSAIYRWKFHTDDVHMNFVILHKLSFVVFVNRNQILLILHYTHCAREVCTQPQMSHIFTYVQVTLATLDLQSILEILATDEIHMEDQYQTWMSTATYFESCGTRTTNGRINLSSSRNISSIR